MWIIDGKSGQHFTIFVLQRSSLSFGRSESSPLCFQSLEFSTAACKIKKNLYLSSTHSKYSSEPQVWRYELWLQDWGGKKFTIVSLNNLSVLASSWDFSNPSLTLYSSAEVKIIPAITKVILLLSPEACSAWEMLYAATISSSESDHLNSKIIEW